MLSQQFIEYSREMVRVLWGGAEVIKFRTEHYGDTSTEVTYLRSDDS